MSITAREAKEQALQKIGEMRRLSRELCAIMDELPLPTPEEFEAMRGREAPWTAEAYIAAVIRNAEFHIDEARVILHDYSSSDDEESLAAAWSSGRLPAAPIERSLRYLVEARSGKPIAPSICEELYFQPHRGTEALLSAFLGRLMDLWNTLSRQS